MSGFFSTITRMLEVFVFVLAFLLIATVFLQMMNELAIPTTILVVVIGTISSFRRWYTGLIAVSGILLYTASWFIGAYCGVYAIQAVALIGILLWFVAVFRPVFQKRYWKNWTP